MIPLYSTKQIRKIDDYAIHKLGFQRVPLDGLLAALAARDCNEVLVEAGPELTGAFLAAGLWDELILYQAPKLLGASARGLAGFHIDALADAVEGHIVETRRFGEDLRIRMLRTV